MNDHNLMIFEFVVFAVEINVSKSMFRVYNVSQRPNLNYVIILYIKFYS